MTGSVRGTRGNSRSYRDGAKRRVSVPSMIDSLEV